MGTKYSERAKRLYGRETAAVYPATGPGRPGYEVYSAALAGACAGRRGLRVLDLGCGTGRYFHCLRNVDLLVGIDVSPHMLQVADRTRRELPALADAPCILLEADFRALQFGQGCFDFVYSIGVLGEYSPFDLPLLESIARWLAPGGRAFFTLVNGPAFRQERSGKRSGLREALKGLVGASPLPRFMSPRVAAMFPSDGRFARLHLSRAEVGRILGACSVPIRYSITEFRDAKHPKFGCEIAKEST